MLKKILFIFVIWWIVINAFAFLSLNRLKLVPGQDSVNPWPRTLIQQFSGQTYESFIGMHVRRQSWRPLTIAEEGYSDIVSNRYATLVYFPLYPLLIKATSWFLSVSYQFGGFLVANIALAGSIIIFYKLVQLEFASKLAERAVWYLLLFPTAFFLTMVYSESLFLLLSLLVFYFALKRKWFFVGIIGFLASLTRITSVFLFLPILWEYFVQEKRVKPTIAFLALMPLGLVSFFWYLKLRFGDFWIFFKAQENWSRGFLQFNTLLYPNPLNSPQAQADFAFAVFFVLLLIALCFLGFKKIRTSYFIYLILSGFVPLFSGSIESTGRYILILFPLYLVAACLGENRQFDRIYTFVSILLLAFSTLLIVNYFWVG